MEGGEEAEEAREASRRKYSYIGAFGMEWGVGYVSLRVRVCALVVVTASWLDIQSVSSPSLLYPVPSFPYRHPSLYLSRLSSIAHIPT